LEHIDPWMGIIFPYANFAIFLFAAVYFFKKPLRNAANKKKEDFEKLAAEASAAKNLAEAKLAELKAKQEALSTEIEELLSVSKQTSQSEAAKIIADAEHIAVNIRQEAKRVAAAEVEKAKQLLRNEVVASVQEMVLAKIRQEMSPDLQKSLVRQRINEMTILHLDT
jgi:F0F1-type ATP synthase membrane subunit b/b'